MKKKRVSGLFLAEKCANPALGGFPKVQQPNREKSPQALVNSLPLPLQKDPACHLVQLTADEVNAPPHRAERRIGLALEVDVPALLAALQLPHVLAILGAGHGALLYRLSCRPPARVTFSSQ